MFVKQIKPLASTYRPVYISRFSFLIKLLNLLNSLSHNWRSDFSLRALSRQISIGRFPCFLLRACDWLLLLHKSKKNHAVDRYCGAKLPGVYTLHFVTLQSQ